MKVLLNKKFNQIKKKSNFKEGRLVVRNLPFTCDEEKIKKHFSQYGNVLEVTLLKKGDKLIGCGFVQFENKQSAANAILKTSGKTFNGRVIIVDWALPKKKFVQVVENEFSSKPKKEITEEITIKDEGTSYDTNTIKVEPDSRENSVSSECGNDSESEGENNYAVKIEDTDNESNIGKNSGENKIDNFSKVIKKNDLSECKTVFLKNLPFQATDLQLKKCAEETVGPVFYALICRDPISDHSKGTGFVKFKDKCDADRVIRGDVKLVLLGTSLGAYKAVRKEELNNNNNKTSHHKDNRNLYLLKEGLIMAGTSAAEGVSESDMAKRLLLEQSRSRDLKNFHKFVSSTRLVVHNLPFNNFDNKKLLKLFKDHSPKDAVITEARVMRNLKDLDENNLPKSKGFGYVNFTRHEDALRALREINNNPSIFSLKKRPIVAFSVENKISYHIRKKRLERSLMKATEDVDKTKQEVKVNKKRLMKTRKTGDTNMDNNDKSYLGLSAKPGLNNFRPKRKLIAEAKLHKLNVLSEKRKKKFSKGKVSRKVRKQRKLINQGILKQPIN